VLVFSLDGDDGEFLEVECPNNFLDAILKALFNAFVAARDAMLEGEEDNGGGAAIGGGGKVMLWLVSEEGVEGYSVV